MPYVYILQNQKTGKFYIGSTSNLNKRLRHHKAGGTPSTKRIKPDKLVFKQWFDTLEKARGAEQKLKRMKRKDYIQKIVKDGYIKNVS